MNGSSLVTIASQTYRSCKYCTFYEKKMFKSGLNPEYKHTCLNNDAPTAFLEGNLKDDKTPDWCPFSAKKLEKKQEYIIGCDFASKVHHACCLIAKMENGKMIIIDSLVSRNDDDVKRKIEEYDPDYFSLNSIHYRRTRSLELRNSIRF